MVSKIVAWVSAGSVLVVAAVTTVLLVVLFPDSPESSKLFDETVVDTKLGRINGSIFYTRLDNKFIGFRGIRYAEAPIDDLRLRVSLQLNEMWKVFSIFTLPAPSACQALG